MITSKSAWKLAQVALSAGKEAFSDYSHPCSPKKFTQPQFSRHDGFAKPQLFACLVLRGASKEELSWHRSAADRQSVAGRHRSVSRSGSHKLARAFNELIQPGLANLMLELMGKLARDHKFIRGD